MLAPLRRSCLRGPLWYHSIVQKTDDEWRATAEPDQFHVLRGHARTRRHDPLNDEKREGTSRAPGWRQPLFSSETKFESGTAGRVRRSARKAVATTVDRNLG